MSETANDKPTGVGKNSWFRQRVIPILVLLFIVAIVVVILSLYRTHPEKLEELQQFGYLGVFVISIILNATLVLPAGNFVIIAALGGVLPSATLVGLIGGLGAAIGEITGYAAGYSGREIISRRQVYYRLEGWVKKWGALSIFLLSAAPVIFDIVGLAAGALRFPFWKFFIATWLGRSILYLVIAWAGAMGWEALLDFLG
ncbi:MAG: VTT domain-containing protein [Dehalococcoidales bacterium]|nr:VTT domain-containing protein [Dehalococcoidales bacterium]